MILINTITTKLNAKDNHGIVIRKKIKVFLFSAITVLSLSFSIIFLFAFFLLKSIPFLYLTLTYSLISLASGLYTSLYVTKNESG